VGSVIGSTLRARFSLRTLGTPNFDACRRLVDLGFTGRLEVWRAGKAHPDMIVPAVNACGRWTIVEYGKAGPTIAPWKPFAEDAQPNAVSCAAVLAPAAENFTLGTRAPVFETAA
jgi:hypothetical protein